MDDSLPLQRLDITLKMAGNDIREMILQSDSERIAAIIEALNADSGN